MRKLFFLFFLLAYSPLILAQHYQVEVNNHRAGSFKNSVEIDRDIHNFSTLDFQILTLTDTLQFFSNSHFVESDSGFLKFVEWTQIFQDTVNNERYFKDTPVFGPEKTRVLCIAKLDTIGATICFPAFSTELNQIIEVKRELLGYSIEKAEKLHIVKETIGAKSTIHKFDRDFRLVETSSPSPFGEIKLTRVNQIHPSQFFDSEYFQKNGFLSNIRFPDPNQISSVKLRLEGLDSLAASSLIQHNQKITSQHSSSLTMIVSNEKESFIPLDSTKFPIPEILWSKEKTMSLLDSLSLDSLTLSEKFETLKSLALQQPYPMLSFYQLILGLKIPARLVYGYTYNQWFWTTGTWTEIAIDGKWETHDLLSEITSTALKVATYRSKIGESPSHSYLSASGQLSNIIAESFTLNGKKQAVSSQALPYYFENPVYENEGLGIRFQMLDGFQIKNDGTESPSSEFLSLENSYQEKISFYQILTINKKQTEERCKKEITNYIGDPGLELQKDKKLDFWYGFKGQKGAIAIPQGQSFIFITIDHEDPEFTILVLTRKNLHLKY